MAYDLKRKPPGVKDKAEGRKGQSSGQVRYANRGNKPSSATGAKKMKKDM